MTKEIIKPDYSLNRDEMMLKILEELELKKVLKEIIDHLGEREGVRGIENMKKYSEKSLSIERIENKYNPWENKHINYEVKWKSSKVFDLVLYKLKEKRLGDTWNTEKNLIKFVYCEWVQEVLEIYNRIEDVIEKRREEKKREEKRRRYKNFRIDC